MLVPNADDVCFEVVISVCAKHNQYVDGKYLAVPSFHILTATEGAVQLQLDECKICGV
jgi:hypothetical protein